MDQYPSKIISKSRDSFFGISNDITYNEYAGEVLSVYILLNFLNAMIHVFTDETNSSNLLIIVFGLFFICFVFIRSKFFGIILRRFILSLIPCLLVFGIAFFWGHDSFSDLFSRLFWFLFFCLPLFSVFLDVDDTVVVLNRTKPVVYICSFLTAAVMVALFASGSYKRGNYNMGFGYAMVYSTLYSFYLLNMEIKPINVFICIANIFAILTIGSRGPVLCIVVFLLLFVFFHKSEITKNYAFFLLFVIVGLVLIVFGLKLILSLLISVLGKFGIYSRTLSYFLERPTYTGREVVWASAIKRIIEQPLLGWGIGVDTSLEGFYPHQLFLELLLHFGIPIGGFLSVVVLSLTIKTIFVSRKNEVLSMIMFSYGFIPLMLSSEYLVWPSFWAFLALCIKRSTIKKAGE